MEKLMDYDPQPFKHGDVVECVSGDKKSWMRQDGGIKIGDRLIVDDCSGGLVRFTGKKFLQDVDDFQIIERSGAVEPENSEESVTPSARLESALKFLETSGDVFQALKIAAGVQ